MRSVHFGISTSYLSARTFPKAPHFSIAAIQFRYFDSCIQFVTCLIRLFSQSAYVVPNYSAEIK